MLQEVADVVKESSLVVRTDSCEAAQELATPLHWGRQSLLNGGQRIQDTLCIEIHRGIQSLLRRTHRTFSGTEINHRY